MAISFKDKVAIVTGAGGGLGRPMRCISPSWGPRW